MTIGVKRGINLIMTVYGLVLLSTLLLLLLRYILHEHYLQNLAIFAYIRIYTEKCRNISTSKNKYLRSPCRVRDVHTRGMTNQWNYNKKIFSTLPSSNKFFSSQSLMDLYCALHWLQSVRLFLCYWLLLLLLLQ